MVLMSGLPLNLFVVQVQALSLRVLFCPGFIHSILPVTEKEVEAAVPPS